MTVFDKLLEPVVPILEEIEQSRRKHGNETLTWLMWVRALIYFFTKRCGSRNAWATALAAADPALNLPPIPPMTLSDAMHRFPPTLLRQALARLLASRAFPHHPELALLGHVYAVDGSEFPLIGGMTLPGSNHSMERVKLHLKFHLNQLLPVDFLLGTTEPSERNALRKLLDRGATYVLDRGYFAFALLRDAIAAEAFVVMRAYHSIVVTTVQDLPVTVPTALEQRWTGIRDRLVTSAHPDAHGLVFRLVEFTIGPTTSKLLTNRTDLTTFQVMLLYAYRWQIEIVFTQMTKGGRFPRRTGWYDVPDLNVAVSDDYTVDEQFNQLPALGEIQALQGWVDALAEAADSFSQFRHIDLALRLGI